eukprot:m.64973 g.64973  ORF g.64973 m.64973 type:complete len:92 (-) comp15901_c0_seq4:4-279(-)
MLQLKRASKPLHFRKDHGQRFVYLNQVSVWAEMFDVLNAMRGKQHHICTPKYAVDGQITKTFVIDLHGVDHNGLMLIKCTKKKKNKKKKPK